MTPLHLIWIIPTAASVGAVAMALVVAAGRDGK